jgi:hypothetical protein
MIFMDTRLWIYRYRHFYGVGCGQNATIIASEQTTYTMELMVTDTGNRLSTASTRLENTAARTSAKDIQKPMRVMF